MTEKKEPNAELGENIDQAGFINPQNLSIMEENKLLKKQLDNTSLTLGHLVGYYGPDMLPTAEELVEHQEQTHQEKFDEFRYSPEGEERLRQALEEDGKKFYQLAEEEKGSEDEYIKIWKRHKAETRGE